MGHGQVVCGDGIYRARPPARHRLRQWLRYRRCYRLCQWLRYRLQRERRRYRLCQWLRYRRCYAW